ncbi:MAG: hypothetical protein E6G41_03940 [Actinobacteria bacterium]|nr:MAG: hypothetical protein E6G41_03940 [Actinomycetota bacterium]
MPGARTSGRWPARPGTSRGSSARRRGRSRCCRAAWPRRRRRWTPLWRASRRRRCVSLPHARGSLGCASGSGRSAHGSRRCWSRATRTARRTS